MIPGIIESARSVAPFTDTFDRANAADIATIEYEWLEVAGDWQIDSNTAFTATTAASYPLAAFDSQKENNSVRAHSSGNNNSGYGVSFWVVDQDNWWAAVTESTTSTTTTTTYSCPEGGTLSGTTCLKTCTSQTLVGYTGGVCEGNQAISPDSNCVCNDPGGCGCFPSEVGDPSTCTCYSGYWGPASSDPFFSCPFGFYFFAGGCYEFARSGVVPPYSYSGTGCTPVYQTSSFNCDYAATATTTTTTTYTHTIRILKREAGTVTQMSAFTFYSGTLDLYVANLTVSTNANVVTVTGVNGATSVSSTYTATSPTRSTKQGIIIAPATRAQSTRIDRFDYIN